MICPPCTRGDHCGRPGERSQNCFCQHWPAKRQKAATRPVERPQVQTDQAAHGSGSEADTRPFVAVLTEWQRLHRAGKFREAAVLRNTLIGRLARLGNPSKG